MPTNEKLFTIALPVRNGGEHVKACVASILAQRFGGFDLVVLENASTDGTAEWLRELTDPRIIVLPAERPLSIEENWSRILRIPKHEFLTIIGHDDLLDPDFLSVIHRLILEHPAAALYLTHFRLIDAAGNFARRCLPMPGRETAAEFLAARLCGLRDSFGTGYVLRSAAYDALGGIPLLPKLLCADDALFLLAMGGSYRATALDEVFSYRSHSASAFGSSTASEVFCGWEAYADFLMEFQKGDPAVAEVLRRHFSAYALRFGRMWQHEALTTTSPGGQPAGDEICRRTHALASRFGGEVQQAYADSATTLLRTRAFTSRQYRTIYQLWNCLSSLRLSRWLVRLLSGPAAKPSV